MISIISPAKKLNFKDQSPSDFYTKPKHSDITKQLVKVLSDLSVSEIEDLMNISKNLSQLNKERYLKWKPTRKLSEESKQALFAFDGNVFQGWNPQEISSSNYEYIQNHVRILSGFYGLLRPFDLIMPHRLEMGTALETDLGDNLYEVWQDIVTDDLNKAIKETKSDFLVNLASQQYFKVVNKKDIKADIIQPVFKDMKDDKYKVIAVYAKKARGEMLRHISENKIKDINDLKHFEESGYYYNDKMSKNNQLVFTRG